MRQPAFSLQEQPAKPAPPRPWYVLTGSQKMLLLVVLGGLLYLRLMRRKKARQRICAHCGFRNPSHRSNCTKCSAPLFTP